jgi:heme-degrading monooxygenase HmoA
MVTGPLHVPAALMLDKESLVRTGQEKVLTAELVWTTWRSEESFTLWRPQTPTVQPEARLSTHRAMVVLTKYAVSG